MSTSSSLLYSAGYFVVFNRLSLNCEEIASACGDSFLLAFLLAFAARNLDHGYVMGR